MIAWVAEMPSSPSNSARRLALVAAGVLSLAGCQGDGGGGTATLPTIYEGSSPAAVWSRYFVTAYDMVKVAAVQATQPFVNAAISYTLTIPGHPIFGSGATASSNALRDAHLDYAFSTGLTGKGVTLGMIDSQIDPNHIQFAGKTVTLDGPQGASEFHGTAVASVMVGTGNGGAMIGFAPAANLFAGTLDYNAAINWTQLGQYMTDAKAAGALAVNNSWGLASGTVANTNFGALFGSGAGASYLSAVRAYASSGVVVFAAQNDYAATSIDAMAGLPQAYPDLKPSWIAVINAIPTVSGDTIVSATRLSAPCAEAATYCLAANGQTVVASNSSTTATTIGGGASFAAPQVTGALALLAEAFPGLTPQQLRDRLLATAYNGFFTPSGTVTFAPGVVHGYNAEFGMGFLDLKAALLPIGQVSVPTASGSSLPLGQAAIAGGPASGTAVASALARSQIVAVDAMGGDFTAPASELAAPPAALQLASLRLSRLSPGAAAEAAGYASALRAGRAEAMLDHADLMADPSAAQLFAGQQMPLLWRGGLRLSALRDAGRLSGVSLTQDLPLGPAALRLGLTGFAEAGGVLGVTVPGDTAAVSGRTGALSLGLAAPLARGLSLRAEAELGLASGTPAGMVASFGTLGYNRAGIALDQADVVRAGDVLTLFARTPVAITRGAATLVLPVSYSLNGPSFAPTDVSLSPVAREVDLGLEYARPLGLASVWRAGLSLAVNAGNQPSRTGINAALGVAIRF